MYSEGEAGEWSHFVILKQRVEVDLLDAVDVTRKQRCYLLTRTISRLRTQRQTSSATGGLIN